MSKCQLVKMAGHHFCFWSRTRQSLVKKEKEKRKKKSTKLIYCSSSILPAPFPLCLGLFPNSLKPTASCCSTCSVCCSTLSSDQRRTKWIPKIWLSALDQLCYSRAASHWMWARSKRLDTCHLILTHKAHKEQSVVCWCMTNRSTLVFTRQIFLFAWVWVWIVWAKTV